MALVTCPDCEKQISDAAPACPNCGRPMNAPSEAGGGNDACPRCGRLSCLGGCGSDTGSSTKEANLRPCRGCGKGVSTGSQACPHCGASAPMREISANWVPCPKCGSAKTQRIGPGLMGFMSLVMGSCLLWIPVVGWFLAPIFFLIAVVLWLSALAPSGDISFQCKDCKEWFKVPKSPPPAIDSSAMHGGLPESLKGKYLLAAFLLGAAVFIAYQMRPAASIPAPSQTARIVPTIAPQSGTGTTAGGSAVQSVASALANNKLGVAASDLRAKPNPKGKGTFVYVQQTWFFGVERKLVWLVLDGKAFAINGASKGVTPSLPFPREAPTAKWKETGLDPLAATEALRIVFGG